MGYVFRPAALAISGLMLAGVALAWPSTGQAASLTLSNTAVSGGALDGLLGAAVTPIIEDQYDFEPGTGGDDGWIRSQVFQGAGGASGQYVYLYQLKHFDNSTETTISGFSFDWGSNAPGSAGGITSLYATGASGTASGFVQPPAATEASSLSFWDGNAAKFLFYPPNDVGKGESSLVLGLFSSFAPTTVIANVIDTGDEVKDPEVYAPVPVPAALPLFLTALAGVGFFSRKRA